MNTKKLFVLVVFAAVFGTAIGLLGRFLFVRSDLPSASVMAKLADIETKVEAKEAVPVPSVAVSAVSSGAVGPAHTSALQMLLNDEQGGKTLWCRGILWKGKSLRVVLSDGRTLTERDGVVAQADGGGVTLIDGARIFLIRPAEKKLDAVGGVALGSGVIGDVVSAPVKARQMVPPLAIVGMSK